MVTMMKFSFASMIIASVSALDGSMPVKDGFQQLQLSISKAEEFRRLEIRCNGLNRDECEESSECSWWWGTWIRQSALCIPKEQDVWKPKEPLVGHSINFFPGLTGPTVGDSVDSSDENVVLSQNPPSGGERQPVLIPNPIAEATTVPPVTTDPLDDELMTIDDELMGEVSAWAVCAQFSHRGPCRNQGGPLGCEWRQYSCKPTAARQACARFSHRGPCKNQGGPLGCTWKSNECRPKSETRRLTPEFDVCAEFSHRGPCKNQGGLYGCGWVQNKCQWIGLVIGDSDDSSEEDKVFSEGPQPEPIPEDACAAFSHRGPCKNQGVNCVWRQNKCQSIELVYICAAYTHRGPCKNQGGPLGCAWKADKCQPKTETRRLMETGDDELDMDFDGEMRRTEGLCFDFTHRGPCKNQGGPLGCVWKQNKCQPDCTQYTHRGPCKNKGGPLGCAWKSNECQPKTETRRLMEIAAVPGEMRRAEDLCAEFSHRGPCKNQGGDFGCIWRDNTCQLNKPKNNELRKICGQFSHRGPCRNQGGPLGCAWKADKCIPQSETRRLEEKVCADFTHRGPCKNQGTNCVWRQDKCQSTELVELCASFSHRGPCKNQGGPLGCAWKSNKCQPKPETRRRFTPTIDIEYCAAYSHRGPCKNQGGRYGCVWRNDMCTFGTEIGGSFDSSEEDIVPSEGAQPVPVTEAVPTPVTDSVCFEFSHRGPCRNQGAPFGCVWRQDMCQPRFTELQKICAQYSHRGPCRNQGGPQGCAWKADKCRPKEDIRRL